MKVLVIGSGGREHAIAWKLKQSKHVTIQKKEDTKYLVLEKNQLFLKVLKPSLRIS